MVIYIDVLLALNLFVNYFLLLSVAKFLHTRVRRLRILLSAVIGATFSLLIFLPDFGFIVTFIVKLILGTLLTVTTFGFKRKQLFIKTLICFWGANFLFGGVMLLIWITLSPNNMFYNNGIIYMGISPIVLILGSVSSYCVVCAVNFILSKRVQKERLCKIHIKVDENETSLSALIDSGNNLIDPLSGLSVIVCEFSAIARLLPEELYPYFADPVSNPDLPEISWKNRVRIVPFHAIGASGMLGAFLPDNCHVYIKGTEKEIEALVGVTTDRLSDGEFTAIIREQVF